MNDRLCLPLHFGLVVSGHSEADFLPSLFRRLTQNGDCFFSIRARVTQRRLIGRENQPNAVVGTRAPIMPKDVEEIGGPVQRFITRNPCHFILIVDDLEDDQEIAQAIFDRYCSILDSVLGPDYRERSSMHFLCPMIEAYFFRDVDAINRTLRLNLNPADQPADVEQIHSPKGKLKTECQHHQRGYDERDDGQSIVANLNVGLLLADPNSCGYLRVLFAWCMEQIIVHAQTIGMPLNIETMELLQADEVFNNLLMEMHFFDGDYAPVTRQQLAYFGKDVNHA